MSIYSGWLVGYCILRCTPCDLGIYKISDLDLGADKPYAPNQAYGVAFSHDGKTIIALSRSLKCAHRYISKCAHRYMCLQGASVLPDFQKMETAGLDIA